LEITETMSQDKSFLLLICLNQVFCHLQKANTKGKNDGF
jgi:hypothetical protein